MDDKGTGRDRVSVGVGLAVADRAVWRADWKVEKFDTPIEWFAQFVARRKANQTDLQHVMRVIETSNDWSKLPAWVQLEADALFRKQHRPFEVGEFHNLLLNAGITLIWNAVIGATFTNNAGASPPAANAYYNNTQARLAVGDSSTAAAATQTWLQAATNKYAQAMDATFPSVSAQTVTFKSTITGTNADFAWNEFVTDNGQGSNSTATTYTGSSALNRAVSAQGTKAGGQSWALTETITLS